MIINEKTFEKARKKIRDSAKNKETIVFTSNDDDLNRKILEKEKINILLINQEGRKDFQKQRNSGFNQVLAKIAKKNKIKIGINLDEIIESEQKEKIEMIARIKQNIKLCNKSKLKMEFIAQNKKNERNLHDLKALGLVLGMPTWMTKNL
jgi:ribonuclease P/MRP protein subunit RPP1|tara:strand:- start:949 stop:1398 length:450 start_codon:yes stop_codon:yes gene_type:complete